MTRTVNDLFKLQGKTALVTGGSRGLGLQMAHALGEAGARVMITSRKAGDLEAAAAELKAAASMPNGLPPTAVRKKISVAWPMRRWRAWGRSISS